MAFLRMYVHAKQTHGYQTGGIERVDESFDDVLGLAATVAVFALKQRRLIRCSLFMM